MAQPLHRDDPDKDPLVGNVKVTKQDWLNVAMDTLVSDGMEQVKVLTLAERLSVSRSSFYWYFKSRQDLLDALLDQWLATNTAALVAASQENAKTITQAVSNVFACFINPARFHNPLDFAIRDWARRSGKVRRVLDRSDTQRLDAITQMFMRFDYAPKDAAARARVLYYMQIGYTDAELQEPLEQRLQMVSHYLYVFTGKTAPEVEIAQFADHIRAVFAQDTGKEGPSP
jgi:AcrR family transcriptional regulator